MSLRADQNPGEIQDVGCAIVERQGRLLISQRKPGDHLGGYWEFPGGTRLADENITECLIREVWEELGVMIRPRYCLCEVSVPKKRKILKLYFYICEWRWGRPAKRDCLDFCWVAPENLGRFMFPPSDAAVIRELARRKTYYFRRRPFE